MAIQVTRTYIGSIQNQRQVQSGLDSLGDSASKIWNVARWTADRIWDETGKIPDVSVLKAYMKNQACWKDLNAQSSQKVIEELSDAFQSWFDLRQKDDTANPPGYRKHGDERPRAVRSRSKKTGSNTTPTTTASDSRKVPISRGIGRISCCANTRPALTLISQKSTRYRTFVRSGTVTSGELHFVCKVKLKTNDSTGNEVAGIDLGITNIATVAFPDEYVLYPGNSIKQDKHYFKRSEYDTEGKTAHLTSRRGHVENLLTARHTFSTFSQTPSSQSVSNVVLERWQ